MTHSAGEHWGHLNAVHPGTHERDWLWLISSDCKLKPTETSYLYFVLSIRIGHPALIRYALGNNEPTSGGGPLSFHSEYVNAQ